MNQVMNLESAAMRAGSSSACHGVRGTAFAGSTFEAIRGGQSGTFVEPGFEVPDGVRRSVEASRLVEAGGAEVVEDGFE